MQTWLEWARIGAAAAISLASHAALAQDASADPAVTSVNAEAARLNAETALINAQKANNTAKYGEAATAPQGNISDVAKFTALAQWTHADALVDLGNRASMTIAKTLDASCKDKTLFITSVGDGRPAQVGASAIHDQLETFTSRLQAPKTGPTAQLAPAATAATIKGFVGTLDSLLALFRSDYAITEIATTADDMALRIAIAKGLAARGTPWGKIQVDGLNRAPVETLPLMVAYAKFDTALSEAMQRNSKEKDAKKKENLAAVITNAEAFNKAITAQPSTSGGQSPLVAAALAFGNPPASGCVLFATYAISTSAITRKKLLSRNDHITSAMGGLLKLTVFDTGGELLAADVISIRRTSSQDLKVLEKGDPADTPTKTTGSSK